ncbi:GGDEF domain-containing protein [Marinospirillum perlucidum]|uniref:GGDEF domain-containing protein n=1 Tax=Marinospirillum perlucidum TaxID=1982602 RepID=UPI0013902B9B|nr:GGDEF domain-containing protein [Marinospirillum perlucidum]
MQLQEEAAQNPKQTLFLFRNQLTFNVQLWCLLLMLPLVVIQFLQQNLLLTGLIGSFIALLVFNLIQARKQPLQNYQGLAFIILASGCVLYSTWLNGHQGIYWAFPLIATYFFMLKPETSRIAAIIFLALFIPLVGLRFPPQEALRIIFSLGMSTLLISYFAFVVIRLHKNLVKLATCDPLTGCLNRSQLEDLLSRALKDHKKKGSPATLLLLDLDHFKAVNDRYGHHRGDLLLQGFCDTVRKTLRSQDKLFRLGGEEFLVLLDQTGREDALAATERLLQTLRETTFAEGLKVTASAGLATASKNYSDWSLWLHEADECLYQAKSEGRDSYRVA